VQSQNLNFGSGDLLFQADQLIVVLAQVVQGRLRSLWISAYKNKIKYTVFRNHKISTEKYLLTQPRDYRLCLIVASFLVRLVTNNEEVPVCERWGG
jgi:hypothetical protein